MKLEGTLDAFSLPDILSLLSTTGKTGALHVTRVDGGHGAVHLRDGCVTGARTHVDRQELGRRLVGSGLVDGPALDKAVERHAYEQQSGLGVLLVDAASLDAATARELAAEQAVDAVFDLLRWTEGAFAFDADEQDPDDVGAALPVEQVVADARARLDAWPALCAAVPSHDAVVAVATTPPERPELDAADWWLLALVDGRRSTADLVTAGGRGEYATVRTLAGLLERGLLVLHDPADAALGALQRQQALLAGLEDARPVPQQLPVAALPAAVAPRPQSSARPVPASRPAHGGPAAPSAPLPRSAGSAPLPVTVATAQHAPATTTYGGTRGSAALQPEPVAVHPGPVAPLDGVDTTLLLRLIAGVRGL